MRKALYIIITITLLLAACKKESNTDSSSLIGSENLAEKCTDSASFVDDITIPDHTTIKPGATFTKTWRVKNTGTCIWNDDYSLAFAMNTNMGTAESAPLQVVPPGKEINISMDMSAPNEKGSYRADFQLLNADGDTMPIDNGYYLWTIITVEKP